MPLKVKSCIERWTQTEISFAEPPSDNVIADLGLPDPETRLLKSRIVGKTDEVIENGGLTRAHYERPSSLCAASGAFHRL
ncbi:hypothetical protein ACE10Z_19785 [Bradyrhizobium sp. Pha-3]|uniref:hypothetical protein n=1 Tax=Bradyrhizobium sp. Pha-3 TaxID=208375 RepID=UPI0035D504C1